MDSINGGTNRVPESNWSEKFNLVPNKIASFFSGFFSGIKMLGYKLRGIMGLCLARLKNVILGEPKAGAQEVKPLREEAPVAPQKKSPVASQEKSPVAPQFVQLREEAPVASQEKSPVAPQFVLDMRSRWVPTRDKLDAMRNLLENSRTGDNANTKPALFERDLDALSSTIMMVISVLEKKTASINSLLWSRCTESINDNEKNKTKIKSEIMDMEQVCALLEMALKAREQKHQKEAIYYEMVSLGKLLSICFGETQVHSTDIESIKPKQDELLNAPYFSTILDAMESLKSIADTIKDPYDIQEEIPPAVYSKGNDMMKLVDILMNRQLSFRIVDDQDSINGDFEKAFCQKYPEWNKLDKQNGTQLMFYRLLAKTNCLDLDDTKDMGKFDGYIRRLDEAKRLFYREKNEEKALKIAAAVVNEVFDIKPRSYGQIQIV